jgi:hypothetical protein
MKAALIGFTGFVGSNLLRQYDFTDFYNSKNFHEMKEQNYDLVVCAGVSAVKWLANKESKKDLESIGVLESILATINTKQFILISTIDVYPLTQYSNEDFDCSSMENHAYGTHRLAFEKFCAEKFDDCTIVRLPGLFGDGLKKNVIYDLLNDNCLEMINTKSSFQYYYLKHLWKDIQIAIDNGIKLINLFTEPVPTQDIFSTFFLEKKIGQEAAPEGHYDLRTKHAGNWNNSEKYIYTKDEMMQQLSEFIESYKKQKDNL